uniref:Interleukin-5 n=1 Tax=Accipiter nisus TaxID=211598 RepID=A0A8B9NTK7_9AVES
MKIHLYILLLAASISAAPQMSNMAELQILLQQMCESMTKDSWVIEHFCLSHLQIQAQVSNDLFDVNCISTIFEGTEQLKTNLAMKKFSVFFQKFERLKQLLTPRLAKEGKCDTERKNAAIFLEKLMVFIRKVSKTARP